MKIYKKIWIFPITIILLFITTLITSNINADDINGPYEQKIHNLINNGSCILIKNNTPVLTYNPDKLLIPASTWKIVIALAALETLGENYHFKTEFYLGSNSCLYIKGYGDPFLISEEIDSIFKNLSSRGINKINNIYLDNSSFSGPDAPPGVSSSLNPYDVTNSALAVNFNTINFYTDDSGAVFSAEEQTPTLPIMKKLGRKFKKGKHRINISGSSENVLRHTGELFRAFQNKHGISGNGIETQKETPPGLKPFYIHYSSKPLRDIIKAMMLYSNNYIANQIYLTMGAAEYGYPATWEKSQNFLRGYIDKTFPKYSRSILFDEGSGISRNNRITADAMIKILERFKTYAGLLSFDNGILIKSGTLRGVYSYAGYFIREKEYDSFVIILNQDKNYRERVLDLMKKHYNNTP